MKKNNKVLIGIVVFGLAVLFAIWGFNKINRNSDNKIVENEKWSKVELIKLSYSHVGNISPNDYKKLYELLSDAAKNEVQSDKVECVDFDIKIYTEDAEKPAIEIFVQKDGIVELKESGKCFKGSKELIEFLANAYE